MERHFDQELAELKTDLLHMGVFVEDAIAKSVDSLRQLDAKKAGEVIDDDKIIDDWENQLDEKGLDLLALRQPMASDLRFIAMSMKITTDLERMADLAVDIAQRVLDLAGKPLLKPLVDIPKLAELSQLMTRNVISAFVDGDVKLAESMIAVDQQADLLRNAVQQELINEYMAKDASTAERAVPLLLVARHLERICDHATNIAEDVIFMFSAKVVKHHPEKLTQSL